MSGNTNFTFDDIAVVSIEACEAPNEVTSADIDERLSSVYEKVGSVKGLLEGLAGIRARRQWDEGFSFMEAAAMAGEKALVASGVDRSKIGLLIDTSVCRERLEPSSAVTVCDLLGLPSTAINFDLSNACLGFLNAIHVAGSMIESGSIDYALIVDGEGTNEIEAATMARLHAPDAQMADLYSNFASLTLGSGSAAMVLGRHSENSGSHRVTQGFFRAETKHHNLCVGSLQEMRTDTAALLAAGTALSKTAWDDSEIDDANGADCFIIHQISSVHTNAMIDILGLDADKVPLTFPDYGNIGPCAIPFTLAKQTDKLSEGDRVLCMGIGSGLNAAVVEMIW